MFSGGDEEETVCGLPQPLGGVLSIFFDAHARLNFSGLHPVLETSLSRLAVEKQPYPRKNAPRWAISPIQIAKYVV